MHSSNAAAGAKNQLAIRQKDCEVREKTNKMQLFRSLLSILSQHVLGIIMPIFRRTRHVLLHVVCSAGSAGCGS